MSELLIHCGLHKTGSSAFQAWTVQHGAALAERGIHVPLKLAGADGNAANLALQVLTLGPGARSPIAQKRQAAFVSFCRAAEGPVLVSAEDFESRLTCLITEAEIDAMQDGQAEAEARLGQRALAIRAAYRHLRDTAAEAGRDRIRLAFVLRNRADKISSGFAQRAKQLSQANRPSGPFMGARAFSPHAVVFRMLEDEGAEIRLGRVGQHPGGVAPLVCDLLGVTERVRDLPQAIGEVNASIGEVGVVLGLDLRAQLAAHGLAEDKKLRTKLSRHLAAACAGLGAEGLKDRGFNYFAPRGLTRFQAGQARLDAALSPWLAAEDIAALGVTRLEGAASPLQRQAFTPGQEDLARQILSRLRKALDTAQITLPFPIGETP